MTNVEQNAEQLGGPGETAEASPAVQLAEEIAADYARFAELTDEAVKALEQKIVTLEGMTQGGPEWGPDGELTDDQLVLTYKPFDNLVSAAFAKKDKLIIAGGHGAYWLPSDSEQPSKDATLISDHDLASGKQGDFLIGHGGNWAAFDEVYREDKTRIALAYVNEEHDSAEVKATYPAGDDVELWAVSCRGETVIEDDDRLKILTLYNGELKRLCEIKIGDEPELEQVEWSPDGEVVGYQRGNEITILEPPKHIPIPLVGRGKPEIIFKFASETPIDLVCPLSKKFTILHEAGKFIVLRKEDDQGPRIPSSRKDRRISEIATDELPIESIDCFAVSEKLGCLAIADGKHVAILSIPRLLSKQLEVLGHYEAEHPVTALGFSPDENMILIGQSDGTVKVFTGASATKRSP